MKRPQRDGVLTNGDGEDLLAQREADSLAESERRQNAAQPSLTRQSLARCKRCSNAGHNSCTCKRDTIDTA
jgi:hypothetical protein